MSSTPVTSDASERPNVDVADATSRRPRVSAFTVASEEVASEVAASTALTPPPPNSAPSASMASVTSPTRAAFEASCELSWCD